MAVCRLGNPHRFTRKPLKNLSPSTGDRIGLRKQTRIRANTQKGKQTRPWQSHRSETGQLLVEPAFRDLMLRKRDYAGVDKDIGVHQYHLYASPSMTASTSAMLSIFAILG